jgi:hypothetical protein
MPIVHFLLVYDRKLQKLVVEQEFTNSAEAVRAYGEMEDRYKGDDEHMEIVLVGADSIETIKLTHGNYFDAVPPASPYLAGV